MAAPAALLELLSAHGPSGYEAAPAAVFRRHAEAFAEVEGDTLGSTVARVKGTADGPSVAVVGHIDEIGLIVTHIDDKGFLWFTNVGGWDPIVLVGQRVAVATREGSIPGVVARKAIHLLEADDRKKAPELKALHIDIGARDGDDARGQVRVGDVAVIAGDPVELLHDAAVREGLAFTIDASGRYTGTDADAINLSRAGVPTGLIQLPLRYMHSPVEMVQLSDVRDAARLVAAFCLALEPGLSLAR